MRLELPENKTFVHQMVIPIRWGDQDAMGHLNNTIYFRYMESVRIDWFRTLGYALGPQGEGFVIVNAFCNFIRQLEYPGDVLARMYVSDAGRTSFETWFTMERADQAGVIHATGGATTVWVDFPKQKSLALPGWVRAIVAGGPAGSP